MFRSGKRLIAMLTLTAYLLGNMHASIALCALPQPASGVANQRLLQSKNAMETSDRPQGHTGECCVHCTEKSIVAEIPFPNNIPVSEETPYDSNEESEKSTETEHSEGPTDCGCPCCPNKPSKDRCPCPDNCTFCSAAKVPVLVDSALFQLCSPPTGERLIIERQVSCLAYVGELYRPPRI